MLTVIEQDRCKEAYTKFIAERLGHRQYQKLRKLISLASSNLWNGPQYSKGYWKNLEDSEIAFCRRHGLLDGSGSVNFSELMHQIGQFDIPSVYYEPDSGCIMEHEPEGEYYTETTNGECVSHYVEPMPFYEYTSKQWLGTVGEYL